MKAETADYLAKARTTLADAQQIAALLCRTSPRARHTTRRFMPLRRTSLNVAAKWRLTHRGVRSQFTRLARHVPRIDRELTRFLTTAYQLKATTDYGIGPAVTPI